MSLRHRSWLVDDRGAMLVSGDLLAHLGQAPDLSARWRPSVSTVFSKPANDVQAAAQAILLRREQDMQASAQSTITNLAGQAGITVGDIKRTQAAFDQYAGQAISSVAALASGQQAMSFSAVSPFIGMALAIGGAAPIVGTVAAAALALMDVASQAIDSALKPPPCSSDPTHQWQLPAGACIHSSNGRPNGPDIIDTITGATKGPNPDWVGWPAFEQRYLATQDDITRGNYWQASGNHRAWKAMGLLGVGIDSTFVSDYAETIGCEMDMLGPPPAGGEDHGMSGFFRAYYRALQHAWEFGINGYQIADPWQVFSATQLAWNASHAGPSVELVATPRSNAGSGGYPSKACVSRGAPNDPNGFSFIGSLLNGDRDPSGQHHATNLDPINVGPSNVPHATMRLHGTVKVVPSPVASAAPSKLLVLAPAALGVGAALYLSNPVLALAGIGASLILHARRRTALPPAVLKRAVSIARAP